MAKVQTRRSISVSRPTYERLKAYCEGHSISMSQFVERRIGDFFAANGTQVQPPAASTAIPPQRPAKPATPAVTKTVSASNEQQASHIFTF